LDSTLSTLYKLKTGAPIEMTGVYDEMSERSYPFYPGGTSLQRWHCDLLRHAMEAEGFDVYELNGGTSITKIGGATRS
jgi:D-alanyl-D-alanine dipeptidase